MSLLQHSPDASRSLTELKEIGAKRYLRDNVPILTAQNWVDTNVTTDQEVRDLLVVLLELQMPHIFS